MRTRSGAECLRDGGRKGALLTFSLLLLDGMDATGGGARENSWSFGGVGIHTAVCLLASVCTVVCRGGDAWTSAKAC